MSEDGGVESREEARRSRGVGGRAWRPPQIEELAPLLVAEAHEILHACERGANVRHAHAAPRRDVRDARRPECREVMTHDQVVGGLRVDAPPERGGWRDVTRELPILEVRCLGVPHQAARRDGRPEEPAAETLVRRALRHVLGDPVTDLLAGARRLRGEAEDVGMHATEIGEQRAARRSPCAEPSVERRERIRRVLACRYEMECRAHERRLDELALVDRRGELVALEPCESCPKRDVRRRRPLRLKPAQALDGVDDAHPLPLEQHLPREKGAVQLTKREDRRSGVFGHDSFSPRWTRVATRGGG